MNEVQISPFMTNNSDAVEAFGKAVTFKVFLTSEEGSSPVNTTDKW